MWREGIEHQVTTLVLRAEGDGGGTAADGDGAHDSTAHRSLRIGAVFIILATGALGALAPALCARYPGLPSSPFFRLMKGYAAGVVLATGVVHMLTEGLERTAEGLSDVDFPVGAILVLGAILVTLVIEQAAGMFFNNVDQSGPTDVGHRLHSHHPQGHPEGADAAALTAAAAEAKSQALTADVMSGAGVQQQQQQQLPGSGSWNWSQGVSVPVVPTVASPVSPGDIQLQPMGESLPMCEATAAASPVEQAAAHLHHRSSSSGHGHAHHGHSHDHSGVAPAPSHGHSHGSHLLGIAKMGGDKRKIVIAHILELGIAFHSVIIGITLGVTTDLAELRALIAALSFHQFFEGFALGSAVLEANMKYKFYIYIMAFLFSITTPIGIAIGIGISSTYEEESKSALVTQGVFDCVSAGILIYMALVDLISEEFRDLMTHQSYLRLSMLLAVAFGSGCMSILAIWA